MARGQIEKSRVLGFHEAQKAFTELSPQGAVLVGFDVGLGKFFNIEVVYALRPLYRTAQGEDFFGDHGRFADQHLPGHKTLKTKVTRTVRLQAPPGYAVGGVTVRSGLLINGLAVTFMRIDGRRLDPTRTYVSDWVGDRTGGGEASVSGSGAPVVGVCGSEDDEHVQALGLIFADEPPPPILPAEPPPPRIKTAERPPAPAKAERPPVVPPADPPKAELPKAEPPAVPPAEPPEKAAEPVARSAPKDRGSEGTSTLGGVIWIPFIIFGTLAVPITLVLLTSLGRKAPAPERGRSRAAEDGILDVLPADPVAPGAFTDKPPPPLKRVGPASRPGSAEDDILDVLPADPPPGSRSPAP